MTRVNVVPPAELTRQHLIAEIRELPRVFTLARKNTAAYGTASNWRNAKYVPTDYVLGTGHVNFFADKLLFLANRYADLCNEWRSRGYHVNQISDQSLLAGIHPSFFQHYEITDNALKLNRSRIADRLAGK